MVEGNTGVRQGQRGRLSAPGSPPSQRSPHARELSRPLCSVTVRGRVRLGVQPARARVTHVGARSVGLGSGEPVLELVGLFMEESGHREGGEVARSAGKAVVAERQGLPV
jgi:hypothetical protein